MAYLWIVLGAVVGASARYFLSAYIAKALCPTFPYGTLLINISGSLLLGFFLIWAGERALVDIRWRWLIAVGFCGSRYFQWFTRPSQACAPAPFPSGDG